MLNCCKWAKVGLKQITQQGVDMSAQVYCSNCGKTGKSKVAGSLLITFILIWFFFIPAIIYEIWRAKNKRCRNCGSQNIMPVNSPMAQQRLKHNNAPAPQLIPQPVQIHEAPQSQPVELYAIDEPINGGLIEFFGLSHWYEAVFTDEQQFHLEQNFGEAEGNRLASGGVRFKFPNVDVIQFLYGWQESLSADEESELKMLVDEQLKREASKFCKIDDNRWDNEKYYKSWFALMKHRIDALTKLKSNNYFAEARFDPVNDNYKSEACDHIGHEVFNIQNGELDRAFDQHFSEPIKGCRCSIRGIKS